MLKIAKDKPISVLNVGTKILLKDVMDTYLRSLGAVKTYYAHKLSTAVDTFREKSPQIIFCEQSFPEGSSLDFIQQIGGLHASVDHYFVLAVESSSDDLISLAEEKGVDEILVKPFATEHIHRIVERYFEKASMGELDWVKAMRVARQAFREKRFQEADDLFTVAARTFSQNRSVIQEVAEYSLERNNLSHAYALLDALVSESPQNTRVLQTMGTTLRKMGQYREAAEKLIKASHLSPLNSQRYGELAEVYLHLAEEQVQAALKSENEHPGFILAKAKFQLVRKDYGALVSYLDAKRAFLTEAARKEADVMVAVAKKLGGLK